MRRFRSYACLLWACLVPAIFASSQSAPPAPATNPASTGPSDPKAKQTFAEAIKLFNKREYSFALEGFRKADKQDGGHCIECEIQAYKAARLGQDFKAGREEAAALLEHMNSPSDKAQAHFLAGQVCFSEGLGNNHEKPFQAADAEFQTALQLQPNKAECLYADGMALAHLKQDDQARQRFQQFLQLAKPDNVDYTRAQRFAEHPELARGRVAPNFRFTALDGRDVTLESLTGKVVLIDFWATWCGPCREALPHIRQIAQRFQGQPLVVLSVSLDSNESKWRDFIARNDMTWMQYRDGGSDGHIAKLFSVTAIPATFTIDAEGVLQDQHVGDAEIDGKLKKLVARAVEKATHKTVAELR